MNQLLEIIPAKVAVAFGAITGAISWLLGGFTVPLIWLFIFVTVDYVTGIAAAVKNGEMNSKTGFVGILKKALIFGVVAFCHGVDEMTRIEALKNAAIVAYGINEALSILENAARLGLEPLIPASIKRALKSLKDKNDNAPPMRRP